MLIRPQASVLGDLGRSLAAKQEVQKEVHMYERWLQKMAPSAPPAVMIRPFSPFPLLGLLSVFPSHSAPPLPRHPFVPSHFFPQQLC